MFICLKRFVLIVNGWLLLILQTSDEASADEWETSADKWETSEDTWETSADEWDTNESASPFARRFQMFESLHIADHSYWFNV